MSTAKAIVVDEATYTPNVSAGQLVDQFAGLSSGAPLCHPTDLDKDADFVTAVPAQANAAMTTITAAQADTLLLASNSARVGLIFHNRSNQALNIGFGTTAVSTSVFSVRLAASGGQLIMMDQAVPITEVRGFWDGSTPTNDVRITEFTI